MFPVLRWSLVIALAGALLIATGCGGGGGGSGGSSAVPAAEPGTTVVNGVVFAADSDVLTESPFGESFGVRTVRFVKDGALSDYRMTKTFTGTTSGSVRSLTTRVDFIDAAGQPYTSDLVLNLFKSFFNGSDALYLARAKDGWIYVVARGDTTLNAPTKAYPGQASVGTEWSIAGTGTALTTYRVMATDVTAPRSAQTGCVLLRSIKTTASNTTGKTTWDYYKPGVGLAENTDTDPALDQSTSSGSYLVPNIG